jgi:ABC-type uncharacterized transport system substrate-binding protein
MIKNICRIVFISALLAISMPADAQDSKLPRIGFISTASLSSLSPRLEGFRQGLRELGYIEGKNILVEYRSANGDVHRLPDLAVELVRLKVACIVTAGETPTHAAKEATRIIPIVMTTVGDPIRLGFIMNLARPGGNITGVTTYETELAGKRLELLKQAIPKLSRVALLAAKGSLEESAKEVEAAARSQNLQLLLLQVGTLDELEEGFRSIVSWHADAFIMGGGGFFNTHQVRLVELAAKHRLPGMYIEEEFVRSGGLMTYAANIPDLYHRSAWYVDKILKGAKPADLPVEQPTKFELVINLKTAKQIGLTIPPNVLARADRVIK